MAPRPLSGVGVNAREVAGYLRRERIEAGPDAEIELERRRTSAAARSLELFQGAG